MTPEDSSYIALMRFATIESIVTRPPEDSEPLDSLFRKAAETVRVWRDSSGKAVARKVSASTVEKWYRAYMKGGFEALLPKTRSDAGSSRVLTDEQKQTIDYYLKEYPYMPVKVMYKLMVKKGEVNVNEVSYDSVNRYVKKVKVDVDALEIAKKDMHRYERSHINEVWYGDSTPGVSIVTEDGKPHKFHIVVFIDDASRFIVGADVFFADNYVNVISVMKSAITKYGKPSVVSFDNGSAYKNIQMNILAARLGIGLRYCEPYSPAQKGKVERCLGVLQRQWMSTVNFKKVKSLDEVRKSLFSWIEEYHMTVHSSIRMTPRERFFSEYERIRTMTPEEIEDAFLLEITRKVTTDSVISIYNALYEVPTRFAKKKICVRFTPDMKQVFVVEEDGSLTPIQLLDKHANAIAKRNKPRLIQEVNDNDD